MEEKKEKDVAKIVLFIASILMIVVFAIVYAIVMNWDYVKFDKNTSLLRRQKNGVIIYSGSVDHNTLKVKVYDEDGVYNDKTVVYIMNDKETKYEFKDIIVDAINGDGNQIKTKKTIISQNGKKVFQGVINVKSNNLTVDADDGYHVYNYEKKMYDPFATYTIVGADKSKEDPSIYEICRFAYDMFPDGSRGNWSFFGYGTFICLINIFSIFTAEFFFQMHLAFTVKNSDGLEASEWEIANRYFAWAMILMFAFFVYMVGLFIS